MKKHGYGSAPEDHDGDEHSMKAPKGAKAAHKVASKGQKIGMEGKGQSGKKGASLPAHEAHQIKKSHEGKGGSPFPGKRESSGFKTGPASVAHADSFGKKPSNSKVKC